jgi:N-acetylglucosaminyldiphosphoundecaprenol N-acetyl-beta-D-mannosaminyltransferase
MKIFELEIPKLKYAKFFKEITQQIQERDEKKGKIVFTPNPEICLKTLQDNEFLQALQKADYLTSDGIWLYIAYQIQDFYSTIHNTHIIAQILKRFLASLLLPYIIFSVLFRKHTLYKLYGQRICGSDITEDLVYFCEAKGIRIAILDPYFPNDFKKCEAQKHFSKNLKKVFPNLHFDHYVVSDTNKKKVFEKVAKGKAKVLFSTLGMKKQELSILEWIKKCPNIRLGLAVGSSFDYFTGFQKRAPDLFRSTGFEWLYRIATSPNKLKRLRRIYQAVCVFPIKVIFYK